MARGAGVGVLLRRGDGPRSLQRRARLAPGAEEGAEAWRAAAQAPLHAPHMGDARSPVRKSVRWVADQLGHADPALTLRVYAHAMREEETDLSFAEFGGPGRPYTALLAE